MASSHDRGLGYLFLTQRCTSACGILCDIVPPRRHRRLFIGHTPLDPTKRLNNCESIGEREMVQNWIEAPHHRSVHMTFSSATVLKSHPLS